MGRDLRVPLSFVLPQGWETGDPDVVGVPEAAFVARYPDDDRGFHPTIVVADVVPEPGEDLPSVAARSVETLARHGDVRVVDSSVVSPGEVSAFRQLLLLTTPAAGELRDLVQDQVYLDVADPRTGFRAVVRIVLTVGRDQRDVVTGDFASFVRSFRADWT